MDSIISSSFYAILNGSAFWITIYAIVVTLEARKWTDKAGFLLGALTLIAIWWHTTSRLNFSLFTAMCWLMGLAAAASTLAKQISNFDSPQVFRTATMRKASISSRQVSDSTLSILTLVLPIPFFPIQVGVPLSLLFVLTGAVTIALAARFLARPSRLSCFISALLSLLLVIAGLIPLDNMIHGRQGLGATFSSALCFAGSIFLYYHAAAIGKLTPHELMLANSPSPGSFLSTRHSTTRPGVPTLRAGFSWILDIVARILSGFSGFCKIFQVGAVAFQLSAFFGISGACLWRENPWESFLNSLQGLDSKLFKLIATTHVALIILTILFSGLSFLLKQLSRSLSRSKLTIDKDERPSILFLRAFDNDQAKLPRPPLYRMLWEGRFTSPALDHQLIDEFYLLAPVVALGLPNQVKPPFGASRLYLDGSEDWLAEVIRIAKSSLAIVVVCTETNSVKREISELQNSNLLHKVLFLADPSTPSKGLEEHSLVKMILPEAPELSNEPKALIAGFYQLGGAKGRTLVCNHLTAEDYIVCCNAFFMELTKSSSIARAIDRLPP